MVGGISAVFYGISNMVKYAKSQKTGAQATKDTVKGSAGLGVAAGLGVTAAHAVAGTSLALGSTFLVPITAGVATGYISAKIWNKIFSRKPDTSKIKAKTNQ
jgi:opacity protein-like surface antigen